MSLSIPLMGISSEVFWCVGGFVCTRDTCLHYHRTGTDLLSLVQIANQRVRVLLMPKRDSVGDGEPALHVVRFELRTLE